MATTSAPHHPAPHRHRTSVAALSFGLVAAPLAWLVQTSVNYGVSSHACYPASEPLLELAATWPWPLVLAVNVASIVIAAVAAVFAFRIWRITRGEAEGGTSRTIDAGEGRTRFLSLWATLASSGFAVGQLFSLVAILGVPPCGYP